MRRSPAGGSKLPPPLPLDLHVLGLSLAFILSQDQTLRCWYVCFVFFICLFDSPGGYALIYCVWVSIDRRLLSLVLLPSVYCNCCQCPSALRPGCRCNAVPVSKRVQSYAFLFLPPNFFSTLFIGPNRQIKPILCFTTCYSRQIICYFNIR